MEYDYNKCPECGYVNNVPPDICPACGFDWASYRKELRKKQEAEWIQQAEEERLAELNEDYAKAIGLFNDGLYKEALNAFMVLGEYNDAIEFAAKCKEAIYQHLIENFNNNLFLNNLITKEERVEDFQDPFVQSCRQKYKIDDFKKAKKSFKGYENYKQSGDYIGYCDSAIALFSRYSAQEADYNLYCQATALFEAMKFEEALAAFQKLDGRLGSDSFADKCQDAINKQAIQAQEALYQGALESFAAGNYEDALKAFNNIQEYKDAAEYIRRVQSEINRIKQERAEQRKAQEAALIEKNRKDARIHIAVCGLPIVLSFVFAIILFVNKEQISVISSFGWWCFGWIVFTIASLCVFAFSAPETHKYYKNIRYYATMAKSRKTTSRAVLIGAILCTIIVFFSAIKLEANFEPTQCVSISVTDKEDTSRGSYFDTVITFELSNDSNTQVTYICGEMVFYNGENEVASYNVYFNGEYEAGKEYKTTVEFSEYKNPALYDISFKNLKITYRITSMKFNGEYKEREYDGDIVVIKDLS